MNNAIGRLVSSVSRTILSRTIIILSLILGVNALDDPKPWIRGIPQPQISNQYGEWHVIKVKKFIEQSPMPSGDQYTLLEVDGKKPEKEGIIFIQMVHEDDGKIENEIVVAGYEIIISLGIPDNPPSGFDIAFTQKSYCLCAMFLGYVKR